MHLYAERAGAHPGRRCGAAPAAHEADERRHVADLRSGVSRALHQHGREGRSRQTLHAAHADRRSACGGLRGRALRLRGFARVLRDAAVQGRRPRRRQHQPPCPAAVRPRHLPPQQNRRSRHTSVVRQERVADRAAGRRRCQNALMSVWLITGGAGFIGSNFVRRLSAAPPARLVILDALTYAGNLATISDLVDGERILFVHGDVRDAAVVRDVFARHEVERVVHFAAESHVDRSIAGPRAFIETNVTGTLNLLDAARERWRGAGGRRCFLHVSTDEVYGTLSPTDPPFREGTPYAPNSPYAASKAAADHLVRAWHHTYGLPAIISNCSNNYGPWQFPEKLIPLMILSAVAERELPVYGDGLQIRDWLHVQDHCEALLAAIERGAPGQTYCIGGNDERTNMSVVETICDVV